MKPLLLGGLNERQREAVMHASGPLLVLAGAGSGKTRVIVHRIARLIHDGVNAASILGVTFTNKAAGEMRERLRRVIGNEASQVHLSTFHALGLEIIRRAPATVGLRAGFGIYDTSDQLGLVRELMRRVRVADRRLDAQRILEIILKTKRARLSDVEIDWGDDYELAAYDLYPRYCAQMRAFNMVDFDDLILRAQDVLNSPEERHRWATAFQYLLVDEYQDTSPDQLELVRVLAGEARNVCAVGDDDQSIYAWRGASSDHILNFGKQFPGAQEIVLDQNYRSTSNILAVANDVIVNNRARKAKVLWSALGDGEPVVVVACASDTDEAEFVAETIGRLVYDGVPHNDIAVLYRANVQSQVFEETLALEHVPFRVVGGQAFFDRKEVRDALAYLAVVNNPHDEIALRRIINVPPRGIGPASVERLSQYAETHHHALWWALQHASLVPDLPKNATLGASELVASLGLSEQTRKLSATELSSWARQLFARLRLREAVLEADDAPSLSARRLANLDEVVVALDRFATQAPRDESALSAFLRASALVRTASDQDDAAAGRVTLMTLHSAKGLEFPYVFMVGLEEGLLPHKNSIEGSADLSEERRLCYVGMTRARTRLWLTHVRQRLRYGKVVDCTPSRFLQEINTETAVRRVSRDVCENPEKSDAMAAEFFAKMRVQLGMNKETP